MKTALRTTLLICLALVPTAVFADGGTLARFTIDSEQDRILAWASDDWLSSEERASMRLGGSEEEDVFVFDPIADPPIRFLVTSSEPRAFYCDLNDDGTFQEEEIFRTRSTRWMRDFSAVRFPYRVREGVAPLSVDLYGYFDRGKCHLRVSSVNEAYRGRVRFAGTDYEARLVFISPFPARDLVNEIIILDTSGDGTFDSFADHWLAADGVLTFEGRLWTAATVFSGATAEVTIAPYAGSTGKLAITGEGIHRAHLRLEPRGVQGLSAGRAFPVCLPRRGEPVFELPPGACEAFEAWLDPGDASGVLYHFDGVGKDGAPGATAEIAAGESASMPLGGPLEDGAVPYVQPLERNIRVEYVNCKNAAGIEYEAVKSTDPWPGRSSPENGPPYEVRTADGRLVASGTFDYG